VLNAGKVTLKSLSGIKKHLLTHCAKKQQVGSIARLGKLNIAMQNMLKVKVVSSTLVLPGEH